MIIGLYYFYLHLIDCLIFYKVFKIHLVFILKFFINLYNFLFYFSLLQVILSNSYFIIINLKYIHSFVI
jgi:hypothetical protein